MIGQKMTNQHLQNNTQDWNVALAKKVGIMVERTDSIIINAQRNMS